jgi:Tfp pilus assembly PilM family ATPase
MRRRPRLPDGPRRPTAGREGFGRATPIANTMMGGDKVIGLDVGRAAVRAVWMTLRAGQPAILRVESLALPFDAADIAEAVAPWAEKVGLKSAPWAVALPAAQAMFQPVALPEQDPRTPAQAAEIEVVRYNEMVSDTMVYGFAPIEWDPAERRFLLAMARPLVLDGILGLVNRLGGKVADVIPSPVALFAALAPAAAAPDEAPVIYANVGATGTDVAVGGRGSLLFARSFGVGGRQFTDAIARREKGSASRAEQTKVSRATLVAAPADRAPAPGGLQLARLTAGEEDGSGAEFAEDLRGVADRWVGELQACLSIYRSVYGAAMPAPSRLVMAGGGARLRGFREHAAAKLGMAVDPGVTLSVEGAGERADEFALAAGLALAGLGRAPVALSVLPPHVQDELRLRRQKGQWTIAAGLAAAVLGVSLLGGYRDFKSKEAILRGTNDSLRRRQDLAAEIERSKARSAVLQEMAAPLRSLLRSSGVLRDLILVLGEIRNEADCITRICDAETYFSAGKSTAAPAAAVPLRVSDSAPVAVPPDARPFSRLVIEGYTRDPSFDRVKELIRRLKEEPYVASADLLNDDEAVQAAGWRANPPPGARVFVIDVKLGEP